MKRFAIIIGGCGGRDGSEAQETVLAMFAVANVGGEYQVFAPDRLAYDLVNHIDGTALDGEKRNLLHEAARLARSNKISPLNELRTEEFDALLIPGGLGTAKNLFTFALEGINMKVYPDVEEIVRDFHTQQKPIGAICIAPMMMAALFHNQQLTITLGPESPWSARLREKMGVNVIVAQRDGVVADMKNKIFTTPAYMYDDSNIGQVGNGIINMVAEMMKII